MHVESLNKHWSLLEGTSRPIIDSAPVGRPSFQDILECIKHVSTAQLTDRALQARIVVRLSTLLKNPDAAEGMMMVFRTAEDFDWLKKELLGIANEAPRSNHTGAQYLVPLCYTLMGRRLTESAKVCKFFDTTNSSLGISFMYKGKADWDRAPGAYSLLAACLEHMCRAFLYEGTQSAMYKNKSFDRRGCDSSEYTIALRTFKFAFNDAANETIDALPLLLGDIPRDVQRTFCSHVTQQVFVWMVNLKAGAPDRQLAARRAATLIAQHRWDDEKCRTLAAVLEQRPPLPDLKPSKAKAKAMTNESLIAKGWLALTCMLKKPKEHQD